jgi:hypothetical protein
MSSPARLLANRRNARNSTGPKTPAGAARASRNARRHGFTLPVLAEPSLAPEVDELAREIARSVAAAAGNASALALACRIAEAMIDLRRIRLAKLPLVAALHADPARSRTLRALARLDRYERHALWRRKAAARAFAAHLSTSWPGSSRPSTPLRRRKQQDVDARHSPGMTESGAARQNEAKNPNDINTHPHPSTT